MSEKYRGKVDDKRYSGTEVEITYNAKRCIHAEECIKRLAGVFDTQRRPWILPDAGNAEAIIAGLQHCPSGALHFEQDNQPEPIPTENRIILWHNGPLQLRGDLGIEGASVSIPAETRATLCRCGASENKPFCDNSHKKIDFVAEDAQTASLSEGETGGKLLITATHHGPLYVEGNFRIEREDGTLLKTGTKAWLCRCGHSEHKPFCDNSHERVGFDAE